MTLDEELGVLESQLRRLKIEYEVFFSNPQKKPPSDLEWKVLALLRKFSDGNRMSFSQRFRYNEMAQRYAIYSDLWRKKSRIREVCATASFISENSSEGICARIHRRWGCYSLLTQEFYRGSPVAPFSLPRFLS